MTYNAVFQDERDMMMNVPLQSGQMRSVDADGNVTIHTGQLPSDGSFDNTDAVRTNQPTFSRARLAEMGYTEANAPSYLRPGGGGGNMRMMTPREMLGGGPLTTSERAEARRIASRPTDWRQQILDNNNQFRMMELESADRRAQIDADARRDVARITRPRPEAPRPAVGGGMAIVPDGRGGWRTEFEPSPQDRGVVAPGSPGRLVPDANAPGGQRFEPFPKAPSNPIEYRPFVVDGKEIPGFAIPVDPGTGRILGDPFDYRERQSGSRWSDLFGYATPPTTTRPPSAPSSQQPQTLTQARDAALAAGQTEFVFDGSKYRITQPTKGGS